MQIQAFFDPATFTLSYVVFDEETLDAVVIDPVLDYDPAEGLTSVESAQKIISFVREHGLMVHWVLETHAHADHLSSSQLLLRELGAKVAIGERIKEVQATFQRIFDLPADFATDGSQFDRLLLDGETLRAGALVVEVIATPGHTPACVTFKMGDAIFTGDALFMEDYGTGRCDFPRGSADELYTSVHDKLYALPADTRVFVGHDYQPDGRTLRYETTIAVSRRSNIQLTSETSRETYLRFRKERDATLAAPRLLFPSVQINVDAGRLPVPSANGNRYLKIPLNVLRGADDVGLPASKPTA